MLKNDLLSTPLSVIVKKKRNVGSEKKRKETNRLDIHGPVKHTCSHMNLLSTPYSDAPLASNL